MKITQFSFNVTPPMERLPFSWGALGVALTLRELTSRDFPLAVTWLFGNTPETDAEVIGYVEELEAAGFLTLNR